MKFVSKSIENRIFVLVVWIIQIVWSKFWLNHNKQGPLEWFWRKSTYTNGKN